MSVLVSDLATRELEPVGDWHPVRWTPALAGAGEAFPSQGDKLLRFVDRYWSTPDAAEFILDDWQRWLIRHILEVYPADWPVAELRGQLRYRQVVISLARQNGKSVVGAILALYFLALHVRGPRVISCASIEGQAKIVYDRLFYAIDNNSTLKREIKATKTRGISRRDGTGIYKTMPAKEDSAQGEPITGALYDELHLGNLGLWEALVLGQSAKLNSMLVGITTAGDDDSDLLLKLYDDGEAALAGADERFGFFVWEAADEELTAANLILANPGVACGRIPLATKLADAEKTWRAGPDKEGVTGRSRVIRYTLNRFVKGTAASAIPLETWRACGGGQGVDLDAPAVVFGLDRSGWQYAAITATVPRRDGTLVTELVASYAGASFDVLLEACLALHKRPGQAVFAMPADTLGPLARRLRESGLEAWPLSDVELGQASAAGLAALEQGRVEHPDDPLLELQVPRAKRRDSGEGWRISPTLSAAPVDAVRATVAGLYVAEVRADVSEQMF